MTKRDFSEIQNHELDLPSALWEGTRFPIRHRLRRYEAHFARQTIQIDKTLVAIGQTPSESKRLLCKVFAALAEVEGRMIGTKKWTVRSFFKPHHPYLREQGKSQISFAGINLSLRASCV